MRKPGTTWRAVIRGKSFRGIPKPPAPGHPTQTGESSAILTPSVNTGSMNTHLQHLGERVGP